MGGGSGSEGVGEWVVGRVGTNKHDDTIITHKRNGSQKSILLIIFYECTSPLCDRPYLSSSINLL